MKSKGEVYTLIKGLEATVPQPTCTATSCGYEYCYYLGWDASPYLVIPQGLWQVV